MEGATSLYCTRTSTLLVGAAKRDLACLKLLVEADAQADTRRRRLPGCDKKACEAAVEAGQLECLVLLRQRGARWSPATKALAAERLGYEEAASEEEEEEDHPYTDDEDDDYAFEEDEEHQEWLQEWTAKKEVQRAWEDGTLDFDCSWHGSWRDTYRAHFDAINKRG